jgi:alpha-galactosidase
VFLLRDENIDLSKDQKITIFLINNIFGSLVFTSDNIKKYKSWQTDLLKNIEFFHSAQVLSFSETDDLFEYHFCVKGKHFTGLSNLSHKTAKIEIGELKLLNIFNLETDYKNIKIIKPFETLVYERFK